jgi:hypothetical protein
VWLYALCVMRVHVAYAEQVATQNLLLVSWCTSDVGQGTSVRGLCCLNPELIPVSMWLQPALSGA